MNKPKIFPIRKIQIVLPSEDSPNKKKRKEITEEALGHNSITTIDYNPQSPPLRSCYVTMESVLKSLPISENIETFECLLHPKKRKWPKTWSTIVSPAYKGFEHKKDDDNYCKYIIFKDFEENIYLDQELAEKDDYYWIVSILCGDCEWKGQCTDAICYGLELKKIPSKIEKIPNILTSNSELFTYFKMKKWKKYSNLKEFKEVCPSGSEFLESFLLKSTHNINYQRSIENVESNEDQNSEYTKSQISLILSYCSWVIACDQAKDQIYNFLSFFDKDLYNEYVNFLISKCGYNDIKNSTTLEKFFEIFIKCTKGLQLWLESDFFKLEDEEIKYFKGKLNEIEIHFKNEAKKLNQNSDIWIKKSKRLELLEKHNLTLDEKELNLIDEVIPKRLEFLNNLWIQIPSKIHKRFYKKVDYILQENHLWMTLLFKHLWGIRPFQLHQICKKIIKLYYNANEKNFTITIHFEGKDKCLGEKSVGRILGITLPLNLTRCFLSFLLERIPFYHSLQGNSQDSSFIWYDQMKNPASKDSISNIISRNLRILFKKYLTCRIVRFWIGNIIFTNCKDKKDFLKRFQLCCYLMDHNMATHIKYYCTTDERISHDFTQDTKIYQSIFKLNPDEKEETEERKEEEDILNIKLI